MMSSWTRVIGLMVLGLVCSTSWAVPLPNFDDYSQRTGYVANFFLDERLTYDPGTDRILYSVQGPFAYSNRLSCTTGCVDLEFDGRLTWAASIDSGGHILDPGALLWLGDFGHGFETLASAHLIGVGTQSYSVPDGEIPFHRYGNLQFLFDFGYLNPRVSGMGDQMVLLFEQQFESSGAELFETAFTCGYGVSGSAQVRCDYYSTSGVVGLEVHEPPFPLVMGIALLIASMMRRPRSFTVER